MSHVAETPRQYVCENCQVVHAGTPVHISGGDHTYEEPSECGCCGESTFVEFHDWVTHHN